MDVICSICQCTLSRQPPEGSTPLADLCENLKIPGLDTHPRTGGVGSGDPPSEIENRETAEPSVVTTPCGHLFHSSCLTQWFLMIGHRRCPLCNFITPVHQMLRIYPSIQSTPSQQTLNFVPMSRDHSTDDSELPSELSTSPIFTHTNLFQNNACVPAGPGTESSSSSSGTLPSPFTPLHPPTDFRNANVTPSSWTAETDEARAADQLPSVRDPEINVAGTASSSSSGSHRLLNTAHTAEAVEPETEVSLQVTETFVNGIRTMVYHFNSSASAPSVLNQNYQLLRTDFGRDTPRAIETIRRRQRSEAPRSPLPPRTCVRCSNLSRIQALMTSDLRDLTNLVTEQMMRIESLTDTLESRGRKDLARRPPAQVETAQCQDQEQFFTLDDEQSSPSSESESAAEVRL